jgi:hypothetical protein
MSRPKRVTAARIAAQIEPCHGILNRIARALGVSRRAVYDVVMRDETLQLDLHQAREARIDDAETMLEESFYAGKPWAILEVLHSAAGRRRGWGQTQLTDVLELVQGLKEEIALLEGRDGAP